jgi:hypothetical protein
LGIVTGDESWHYHATENKRQFMHWMHGGSPQAKIFQTVPSAGKQMAMVCIPSLAMTTYRTVSMSLCILPQKTDCCIHQEVTRKMATVLASGEYVE